MAKDANFYDLVDLMKSGLSEHIKEVVLEEIVRKHVEQCEADLREIVKAELSRVTFDRIEGMRTLMDLRDELHIHLNINDEDAVVRKVK
jgi:hypothetical protein